MGFNSVLVVLNDRLSEIENDPNFGKKVSDAIRRFGYGDRISALYITGQTQVISVQHADTIQIVAVGGNTGRLLGYGHYTQTDDQLIDRLTRERLRLKREAKRRQGAAE